MPFPLLFLSADNIFPQFSILTVMGSLGVLLLKGDAAAGYACWVVLSAEKGLPVVKEAGSISQDRSCSGGGG